MPSLDSWIDARELKELANRVTTEAAPSPPVAELQAGKWANQLGQIKEAAEKSGLIRQGGEPAGASPARLIQSPPEGGTSTTDRAAEIHPWAKKLLGGSDAFFCDASRNPWPENGIEEEFLKASAELAGVIGAGEFAGRSLGDKGAMLWVFMSAGTEASFWLSVVSDRPVLQEHLRAVAGAVKSLGARTS